MPKHQDSLSPLLDTCYERGNLLASPYVRREFLLAQRFLRLAEVVEVAKTMSDPTPNADIKTETVSYRPIPYTANTASGRLPFMAHLVKMSHRIPDDTERYLSMSLVTIAEGSQHAGSLFRRNDLQIIDCIVRGRLYNVAGPSRQNVDGLLDFLADDAYGCAPKPTIRNNSQGLYSQILSEVEAAVVTDLEPEPTNYLQLPTFLPGRGPYRDSYN